MDKKKQMIELQAAAVRKDRESDRLEASGKTGDAKLAEMRANAYRRAANQLAKELGER